MKTGRILVLSLWFLSILSASVAAAQVVGGTWSDVTPNVLFRNGANTALLLTDGTVLVRDVNTIPLGRTGFWWQLTPDIKGNYVNGTWTGPYGMQAGYGPLYFASAVLASGKVVVEGGEYNLNDRNAQGGTKVWTNKGSMFDPKTKLWTAQPPPPGFKNIGDAQATVLADGTFFLANAITRQQAILNPTTLVWRPADNNKTKFDLNFEENWNLLSDGTVLTVDAYVDKVVFLPPNNSERYDPAKDMWTSAGNTQVKLPDSFTTSNTSEVGPAVLRPDGTVIAFGAIKDNAVYKTSTGTWMAGPPFPMVAGMQLNVQDGPASLLPCGNVLVMASPGQNAPSTFFEFDGNNLNKVTQPQSNQKNVGSYEGRMVILPTGQVLYSDGSKTMSVYTADPVACPPDPGSAPTITNSPAIIVRGNNKTYQVSGTQFNGKSQGASYGNDAQSATNYPLVQLYNPITGDLFYCRTHDHNSMGVPSMGVATGNLIVTTNFECPNGDVGLNLLYVVANGIASQGVAVLVF